jgi:hypothetical protein
LKIDKAIGRRQEKMGLISEEIRVGRVRLQEVLQRIEEEKEYQAQLEKERLEEEAK